MSDKKTIDTNAMIQDLMDATMKTIVENKSWIDVAAYHLNETQTALDKCKQYLVNYVLLVKESRQKVNDIEDLADPPIDVDEALDMVSVIDNLLLRLLEHNKA